MIGRVLRKIVAGVLVMVVACGGAGGEPSATTGDGETTVRSAPATTELAPTTTTPPTTSTPARATTIQLTIGTVKIAFDDLAVEESIDDCPVSLGQVEAWSLGASKTESKPRQTTDPNGRSTF